MLKLKVKLKPIWSFSWRIGLFIFGVLITGIVMILTMPTLHSMVYEYETIDEFWYDIGLVAPMISIGLMVFWFWQSVMKLKEKRD